MADLSISFIVKFIYSILTIVLLVLIYTYLNNLENKGCACAAHPNTPFIKGFTIFSIIYLAITMLISDETLANNLGSGIVILKIIIDFIFTIVFIYYLYVVFQYTRYLVNEKCKCSVDVRREIIMVGSLIEFALIFILFLFQIIIVTILGAAFTIVKNVGEHKGAVSDVIRDPIGSISKVPQTLKEDMATIGTYVKKTGKELSKIASKRKSK
jgi:hypothetical protein